MNKTPKVLHLVFDAISPTNTFTLIDFMSKKYLTDNYAHSKEYHTLDTRGKMLLSPQMWCRIYTRHELAHWGSNDDVERWDPNSVEQQEAKSSIRYLNIDKSQFIWNKLACKNVPSFIFPYYSYAQYGRRIVVGDTNPEMVNGVFRTFENNRYDNLIQGEFWRKSSDYKFWGMHETPERWNHDNEKRKQEIRDIWDNSTDEQLKIEIPKILDEEREYLVNTYKSNIDENYHIMHEEVIPALMNVDMSNGGYAHIGFIETDSWMHFSEPFADLIEYENKYIDSVLERVINELDPDIVIIHGDHGQDRIRDKHRQKLWSDIEYEGKPYRAARAKWVPCIMFNDHSHYVGGYVFAKDQSVIDTFDKYFKAIHGAKTDDHDPMLMDAVYDYITTEIGE